MFAAGDVVAVVHRDEHTEYPQPHKHGDLCDAVGLWYHRGVICTPEPDTPEGHHKVYFGFLLSHKIVTIPFEDLMIHPQHAGHE